AQIKIEEVFVSKVTEQFLDYIEYMKTQPSRDVDKESDYLAMAAQIIYIKSKSLVPPVEIDGEEIGGGNEEELALIEQLKQREFELIKERTPKLKTLETIGYYFKEPDKEISKVKIVYRDFSVDAMLQAFANLLLRNESLQREKENIKEIPKDVYTVQDRVSYIKDKLVEKEEFDFDELFVSFSRNEVITTFQALLEMLKFQFVMVEQTDAFGNIKIRKNPDADLKDVSNEQFDEYN
ncbi:MAG: segregation/condensation protein A, partial [Clostridia bacterium]|nr:segregation/condensation protein A [Clostridia bacterium]